MHLPSRRLGQFFAGLCLVFFIVLTSVWYLLRPSPVLTSAPKVATLETTAPENLAASSTPSPTPPAAPAEPASQNSPPKRKLYAVKGSTIGTPLSKRPLEVREGAEKGRTLEIERLSPQILGALSKGQSITLAIPDGEVIGVVNLVQHDENGWVRIGGDLPGRAGSFTLAANVDSSGGVIMLPKDARAYELVTEPTGRLLVVERRLPDIHCYGLPPKDKAAVALTEPSSGSSSPSEAPPLLSSRPSAPAVVYLDFDGETVTDPAWNSGRSIVAPASSLTAAQMTEVFNRVKEDYAAFNLDITTSLARYNAVAANRRTRCIITSNDAAAPGAGGVAYVNAFSTAGTTYSSTIPCWVFNDGVLGIAEAASHEVGHTLGLDHDGRTSPSEEYYAGAGSGATGWAPIMGVGYDRLLVQWSKGEYKSANNKQDDLAIISKSANGFGYFTDEAGATTTAAATLAVSGTTINQPGMIAYNDVDVFRFTAAGGTLTVTATPAAVSPNLDIKLDLLNSAGTVVVTANPLTTLPASLTSTLVAGTYYLRVSGTGKGDVLVDGYTSYGSIGAYTLSGTVTVGSTAQPPTITSAQEVNGQVGVAFTYQISATNTPTAYSVTGTLPTGLTLNSTTGVISGTPTTTVTSSVTLNATNAQGTGNLPLSITISSAVVSLASAIDLTSPAVTSTGNALWTAQTAVTFDGVDAAVSGRIGNSQTSSLQMDVTGPVSLEFRWRVDSEANYDKFSYLIDGVVKESISGVADWALRTVAIPAGTHRVEWRYVKDASVVSGADSAWLDTVSLRAAAAIRLAGDLSFGNVATGSTLAKSFTIFNDSTTAINVSSITYPTGFTGAYSGQIAAGASRVVSVTFSPTAVQSYSGDLTVNCDASSGVKTLALSGAGISGIATLANNVPVTNLSGATGNQRTYKIVVPTGTTDLTVTTAGGTGDVDLYLKRGSVPTTTISDLKSDGSSTAETVTALNPAAGDWFVLVDGYAAYSGVTLTAVLTSGSNYTISTSTSGSGTASGGGTFAGGNQATVVATAVSGASFINWTEGGSIASTSASYSFTVSANRALVANFTGPTVLTSNVPVSNLAGATNTELVYRIVVPVNTSQLTVSTSSGTGDADLYLKLGSRPSTTSFDRASEGNTNSESISINRPAAGEWFILIKAYAAFSGLRLNAVLVPLTSTTSGTATSEYMLTLKEMAGTYRGLVGLGEPTEPLLGRVKIELSSRGSFTCGAYLEGRLVTFRGTFNSEGHWSGNLRHRGVLVPVTLDLDLEGQETINGSLKWLGQDMQIQSLRLSSNSALYAGTYLVDLPPDPTQTDETYPQNPGHLEILVKKNGAVVINATLGDSTSFVFTPFLSRDGMLGIYLPLYRRAGSIGGWIQFNADDLSLQGSFRWTKPARPTDLLFPAGFTGSTTFSAVREAL